MFKNILLAGTLILTMGGCSQGESTGTQENAAQDKQGVIPVAVETLSTDTVPSLIYAWGTVEPRRKADILAGVSGTVTSSKVRLGSRVRRGDLLLEIDPSVYGALAQQAKANLARAEEAVVKAGNNLKRHESLFSRKEISETQIEGARLEAKAAEAELAQAKAENARAVTNYRDARPAAPFSGTIANRPPGSGTSVNLAQLLVRVVDISKVLVVAELSEQDLHQISIGMNADIQVEGEERLFTGKVIGIGPEASSESRQFPVEIEVSNPEGHPLKAGMIGRVFIQTALHENVAMVPVNAVIERNGESGFFTLENTTARWQTIVPGPRKGDYVAALEGADEGQTVVVMGQTRLATGSEVRVETKP